MRDAASLFRVIVGHRQRKTGGLRFDGGQMCSASTTAQQNQSEAKIRYDAAPLLLVHGQM
jgi:hypothetical protein